MLKIVKEHFAVPSVNLITMSWFTMLLPRLHLCLLGRSVSTEITVSLLMWLCCFNMCILYCMLTLCTDFVVYLTWFIWLDCVFWFGIWYILLFVGDIYLRFTATMWVWVICFDITFIVKGIAILSIICVMLDFDLYYLWFQIESIELCDAICLLTISNETIQYGRNKPLYAKQLLIIQLCYWFMPAYYSAYSANTSALHLLLLPLLQC